MALWCAEGGDAEVVIAYGLSAFEVVCVSLGFEARSKPLIGSVGPHHMQKSFFSASEDAGEAVSGIAIVAHFGEEGQTAIARFIATSEDVDGATHRRNRQFAGAESTLHLSGPDHEVETCPVAPVYPAVLHVVHGNPIDHHCQIGLVEAPNGDAGIAITSALLGRVYTWCRVENQRKVAPCQLLLNLGGQNVGEGHRCFPVDGNIRGHNGLL